VFVINCILNKNIVKYKLLLWEEGQGKSARGENWLKGMLGKKKEEGG